MDWEKTYGDLKKLNWSVLLIMSLIGNFFLSLSLTLGIILGGLIIIANFGVLQRSIRSAFSSEGTMKTTKCFVVIKSYLRLLVLALLVASCIKWKWVDPVGLALGLSTVVIGIVGLGIKRVLSSFTREAV